MRFVALSISWVPDVDAARQGGELAGLEDPAVAKALLHRRKQSSGRDALRWDQVAIAASTLVSHDDSQTDIISLSSALQPEREALDQLMARLASAALVVTWDPVGESLAALRFRATRHGMSAPWLWQTKSIRELSSLFGGATDDTPGLADLLRGLGVPAAADSSTHELSDAWLVGNPAPMLAETQRAALNLYVLALKCFHASGELGASERSGGIARLRDWCEAHAGPGCSELAGQLVDMG